MELLSELKKQLKQYQDIISTREEKIYNNEVDLDDVFVSRHYDGLNKRLIETKIAILENGGLWDFTELLYADGTPTDAKLCQTKFGSAYRVEKKDGSIEWVSLRLKEESIKKKGYMLGEVKRPAWATIKDNRVIIFPISEIS
ncbi:MAG: hypothetical protein ACH0QD_13520 [Tepidibacillus sp.]